MLILTRKPMPEGKTGNAIHIGDDITVTVMAVNGCKVRLGIDAPKDVAVHRDDIKERMAITGGNVA